MSRTKNKKNKTNNNTKMNITRKEQGGEEYQEGKS